MTQTSATQRGIEQADDKNAIRPFHVNVPEADLTELRRRINATRYPERETVTDQFQGVQLAFIQALARYWATDYNLAEVRGATELSSPIHHLVKERHLLACPLLLSRAGGGPPD